MVEPRYSVRLMALKRESGEQGYDDASQTLLLLMSTL